MLVLDGLREVPDDKKLYVPPFHLGHLGFVPKLEIYYREDVHQDSRYGMELTFTPFKGGRGDLFLLKCVFSEGQGVVLNALKAFLALNLNIVSLESATIQSGKKHVLFSIISWDDSHHRSQVPIDEGTRQKFIDVLPLLPIADWRYLLLIESLALFCGNTLDCQTAADGVRTPYIQLRTFDAFRESSADCKPISVGRSGPAMKSEVCLDLAHVQPAPNAKQDVILLSETETKTLRIILPSERRKGRFLHIAFVHLNRPGALLSIAKLIRSCGFNIITSLLRKYDNENNVWEMIIEYIGQFADKVLPIKDRIEGIGWFRGWCLEPKDKAPAQPLDATLKELTEHMMHYRVGVCRPVYPLSPKGSDGDFIPVLIREPPEPGSNSSYHPQAVKIRKRDVNEMFQRRAKERPVNDVTLALLRDLERHIAHRSYRGTVFVSIPTQHSHECDPIRDEFWKQLKIEIDFYTARNQKAFRSEALARIRRADYFLGVWHPDTKTDSPISMWLPFEWGAAEVLGKRPQRVAEEGIPDAVGLRVDPDFGWVTFQSGRIRDVLPEVVKACGEAWLKNRDPVLVFDD